MNLVCERMSGLTQSARRVLTHSFQSTLSGDRWFYCLIPVFPVKFPVK